MNEECRILEQERLIYLRQQQKAQVLLSEDPLPSPKRHPVVEAYPKEHPRAASIYFHGNQPGWVPQRVSLVSSPE